MPTLENDAGGTNLAVLIVGRDAAAARMLETQLAGLSGLNVIGRSTDAASAEKEITRLRPDVLIVDVGTDATFPLPGCVAVAHDLPVIVMSRMPEHAVRAFEIGAIDFLLQPCPADRLSRAMTRAGRRRAERASYQAVLGTGDAATGVRTLTIPDRHGGYDVPIRDIVWIAADRDYALVHTDTRSHIIRSTMARLERLLPSSFLRVHRSAFVSLAHVRRWIAPMNGMHGLLLSTGTEVGIGPSHLRAVKAALRSMDRGRPRVAG